MIRQLQEMDTLGQSTDYELTTLKREWDDETRDFCRYLPSSTIAKILEFSIPSSPPPWLLHDLATPAEDLVAAMRHRVRIVPPVRVRVVAPIRLDTIKIDRSRS